MKELELKALKSDYTILSLLKPTNIQWSRKYYQCGNFSIQLPIEQYSNQIKYVYTAQRRELGIVTENNYVVASNGFKYVQIAGYFLEYELNDKIVNPLFIANGEVTNEIQRMVTTYKADIPLLEVVTAGFTGNATLFQEEEMELGKKCYEILRLHELSYKVEFDFVNLKKKFQIYKGKDRTQSQSVNNYVVFSSSFGNLKQPNVLTSTTNYKNYAVVYGAAENGNIERVIADLSGGGYKKQIFINASNVPYDDSKLTKNEYRNNLIQYGLSELVKTYGNINNVEFDVLQGSYEYLIDFDLGDKCDIIVKELDLVLEARIIAIYEVVSGGKHTVTLEFGNQVVKV